MQNNSQPGRTFRFLRNPCANSKNSVWLQVTEADIPVATSQEDISVCHGQIYEQMKQTESNVSSHELLILHFLNNFMKTRNRFSVAVTYIRRRFGVQISLKQGGQAGEVQLTGLQTELTVKDEAEIRPINYCILVNDRWFSIKLPLSEIVIFLGSETGRIFN